MTRVILLDRLCEFTEETVKNLILPCALQKGDESQLFRPADVHKMRLPDSSAYKKYAPYIIHAVIGGVDEQPYGQVLASTATIRSTFCVYGDNEQEGELNLLNLMERLRIALLKQRIIGNQFELNTAMKLETTIMQGDTAPYFGGVMISSWNLPPMERGDSNCL